MAKHRAPDWSAKTRPRTRTVRVTEYRCLICGKWREASQPTKTCGPAHRQQLVQMRQRGERPPYAV